MDLPKLRRLVLLGVVVGGIAWCVPRLHDAYRQQTANRLIASAQEQLTLGNVRFAASALMEAWQRAPHNPLPARMLRELAAHARDPGAVDWAGRVYLIEPTFENFRRWFQLALELRSREAAGEALKSAAQNERENPRYYALVSLWHILGGEVENAIGSLKIAISKNPLPEFEVTLASLELRSASQQTRDTARQRLNDLTSFPETRMQALGELFDLAAATQDVQKAVDNIIALLESPMATPERLLRSLEFLQRTNSPHLAQVAEQLIRRLQEKPSLIPDAFQALEAVGLREKAVSGWENLPEREKSAPLVVAVYLSLLVNNNRLDEARAIAARTAWQSREYLSWLLPGLGPEVILRDPGKFWKDWAKKQSSSPELLRLAASDAKRFQNPEAVSAILWKLSEKRENGAEPLKELFQTAKKHGDTLTMFQTSSILYVRDTSDPIAANNTAITGLLLGKNAAESHRLAEENLSKFPEFPPVYSTRALSLLLQDRPEQAVSLLAELRPEWRELPGTQFYRNLSLAAVGQAVPPLSEEALAGLLPEERELWKSIVLPPE